MDCNWTVSASKLLKIMAERQGFEASLRLKPFRFKY